MASFEIDLRDTDGISVEFGDLVRVALPKVYHPSTTEFDNHYYLPGKIVEGVIGFQLSRGLVVRITAIISNDDDSDSGGELVGKTIPLRRTAREWYKVT